MSTVDLGDFAVAVVAAAVDALAWNRFRCWSRGTTAVVERSSLTQVDQSRGRHWQRRRRGSCFRYCRRRRRCCQQLTDAAGAGDVRVVAAAVDYGSISSTSRSRKQIALSFPLQSILIVVAGVNTSERALPGAGPHPP